MTRRHPAPHRRPHLRHPDRVPTDAVDAIVIGAGPNGLVAANLLADRGWEVVVHEAAPVPGGAVRTEELTVPGYHHDVFSAFYPFAAASPALRSLRLEEHGLRWCRSPLVLGHPAPHGPSAVLSTDAAVTEASLDLFAAGDGARWHELMQPWERLSPPMLAALLGPFPPVRHGIAAALAMSPTELERFVRMALLPVRRLAEEQFRGDGARLLLGGLALHADLGPEATASSFYGWLLAGMGGEVGFPVPQGGAGALTAALVRRLESRGGRVELGSRVDRVMVLDGRAVGVVANERTYPARRAVLADVGAPALYGQLVGFDELPARVHDAIVRFERGPGTVKVDWALDAPIPWTDPVLCEAGTVHLADSMDELSEYAYHLATHQLPSHPFLLLGQMSTADPTRSPPGTETAWTYTHVPQDVRRDALGEIGVAWSAPDTERFVDRMEDRIEAHAPGFRDRVIGRHVLAPPDFEAWNANLVGGDTTGGTAQLHQQLVLRPIPGLGRAETPIRRLYLASASAHPGGGVHGAPGANAARAALAHDRLRRAADGLRSLVTR
jgi:phytoene dehydrogenase-like protein